MVSFPNPPQSASLPAAALRQRVMWLQMLAMAFQTAYGKDAPIDIKKSSDLLQ
jgi:hypothetical protein